MCTCIQTKPASIPGGNSFWLSDGERQKKKEKKLPHSVNKSTKQKKEAVSKPPLGWLAALLP